MAHSYLASAAYIIGLCALWILTKRINFAWLLSNWFYYSTVAVYSIAHILLFRFIRVENLNVDRWSVISSFWEKAFHGQYAYSALSHMGNPPGPLPVYFILALPFHLMHEIGYLSLTGLILLAIFLRKKLTAKESIAALMILLFSISVFWEISVRSTILVNGVLFLLYLSWLQKVNLNYKRQFWSSAVLGGLLLSTRTVFAIPLIIYGIYLFKSKEINFKLLLSWSAVVFGVFTITFSPFLIFYFSDFVKINPFSVQSDRLLPFRLSCFFPIIATIAGFICPNKSRILLYTAFIFFLMFITYFAYTSFRYGFMVAYWGNILDLSYSLFAFPMVLYYSFKSDDNQN
jgi:hypothetical protein